jgi:hypothetical protein
MACVVRVNIRIVHQRSYSRSTRLTLGRLELRGGQPKRIAVESWKKAAPQRLNLFAALNALIHYLLFLDTNKGRAELGSTRNTGFFYSFGTRG